ncbi:MAG: hypothetical protein ACP5HF_01945 [Candidatus Micrarchaeia archaeon]
MQISDLAREIVRKGSIKIRVRRSGMLQQLTFNVKEAEAGNIKYYKLYTDRLVDISELIRVAEEVGLPVEAPNGKAFPKGSTASDFETKLFK